MTEMTRKAYPSDLSDAQWNILAALIPPKIGRGENRKVNLREIVNAIFYQLRTGWLGRNRRLSKDYEKTIVSSAAMVKCSNIALRLRRLAPRENVKTFHYRDNTQNA